MFKIRGIIDWFSDYVFYGQRLTNFEDKIVQNYRAILTGSYIAFEYSNKGFFYINEAERQKSKRRVNINEEDVIKQRIDETRSALTRDVWRDILKRAKMLKEVLRDEGLSSRGI